MPDAWTISASTSPWSSTRTPPSTGATTPIYRQSVSATSATLTWKPFLGGASTTQTVTLSPGVSVKVDPNISVPQGAQYAVTVAANGTVAAIVMELNSSGGDNAMIYGGFPAP